MAKKPDLIPWKMDLHEAVGLIQSDYWLHLKRPALWADLGCGTGLFTHALSHYLKPGSSIFAVDKINNLKPGIYDERADIRVVQADFEKDDWHQGKLDGILMANSLHYVKDKTAFLGKCKAHFQNNVFLIVEYDTDVPVPRWVPYPLSFSSLATLFKAAGFRKIARLGGRPSLFGKSNMYAALIQSEG